MRIYGWFLSQVRSATLDTWLPEQVAFIQCELLLNTHAQFFLVDVGSRFRKVVVVDSDFSICSNGK